MLFCIEGDEKCWKMKRQKFFQVLLKIYNVQSKYVWIYEDDFKESHRAECYCLLRHVLEVLTAAK